jgi:hypothetical protein
MSAMEPSTVGQSSTSEPERTDTIASGRTEKPYGDRDQKSVIVKGRLKSPILPVWLSKHFRRTDTPVSR